MPLTPAERQKRYRERTAAAHARMVHDEGQKVPGLQPRAP